MTIEEIKTLRDTAIKAYIRELDTPSSTLSSLSSCRAEFVFWDSEYESHRYSGLKNIDIRITHDSCERDGHAMAQTIRSLH
jgi:hypothetical protein